MEKILEIIILWFCEKCMIVKLSYLLIIQWGINRRTKCFLLAFLKGETIWKIQDSKGRIKNEINFTDLDAEYIREGKTIVLNSRLKNSKKQSLYDGIIYPILVRLRAENAESKQKDIGIVIHHNKKPTFDLLHVLGFVRKGTANDILKRVKLSIWELM